MEERFVAPAAAEAAALAPALDGPAGVHFFPLVLRDDVDVSRWRALITCAAVAHDEKELAGLSLDGFAYVELSAVALSIHAAPRGTGDDLVQCSFPNCDRLVEVSQQHVEVE